MDDTFEPRLKAFVRAGWWTVLIGGIFLALQWIFYLVFMSSRPSWLPAMWGQGIGWETIQSLWLWITAIFKLCLWLMALVMICLTLWSHGLRKQTHSLNKP
jgi:hypothetical protein